MIGGGDPVGVLCDLIETGSGSLDAETAWSRWHTEMAFLSRIGAVTAAEPRSIVTCRACDHDHMARLEFDPSTRKHWHFCPHADRVTVEDAAPATLRANPQWVIEWLARALPLTPPVRTRALIPNIAWYCGEAHIDGNAVTIVLGTVLSSLPVPIATLGVTPLCREGRGGWSRAGPRSPST